MESSPLPALPSAKLQILGGMYILFGSFGLVGLVSNCGLYFAPLDSQTGPMADMLRSNATLATLMRAQFLPVLLYSVLLFGSGIGLLRASPLARKIALGCAFFGFLYGIFSVWLTLTYTLPFTLEHTLKQVKNPAMLATTRNVTLASSYVGLVLGVLYPCVAFFLLKRSNTRPT